MYASRTRGPLSVCKTSNGVQAPEVGFLALVGGIFYSARGLGEPWETLTRLDPIYYLVDATGLASLGFTNRRSGCRSS
jgi:hypothetical protein